MTRVGMGTFLPIKYLWQELPISRWLAMISWMLIPRASFGKALYIRRIGNGLRQNCGSLSGKEVRVSGRTNTGYGEAMLNMHMSMRAGMLFILRISVTFG